MTCRTDGGCSEAPVFWEHEATRGFNWAAVLIAPKTWSHRTQRHQWQAPFSTWSNDFKEFGVLFFGIQGFMICWPESQFCFSSFGTEGKSTNNDPSSYEHHIYAFYYFCGCFSGSGRWRSPLNPAFKDVIDLVVFGHQLRGLGPTYFICPVHLTARK